MSLVIEDPRVIEFDVQTDEMLVNMGPQHPSTHGVLRLLLRTDGEIVHECTPHIGYLHRCAEKIGENLSPPQYIPYTDRMDYLAAMNMNLGFALAVEKLTKAKVPARGVHLRVLIAELGRIASHLVGMGAYGLDLGTFSPFLYAFREREIILDLFEEACGARLTCSYLTVGGATHDLPEEIEIPDGLASLTGRKAGERFPFLEVLEMFLQWLEPREAPVTSARRPARAPVLTGFRPASRRGGGTPRGCGHRRGQRPGPRVGRDRDQARHGPALWRARRRRREGRARPVHRTPHHEDGIDQHGADPAAHGAAGSADHRAGGVVHRHGVARDAGINADRVLVHAGAGADRAGRIER